MSSLPTVLARTGAAEWSRIWTVRSSWWFSLASAVVILGIGTLMGFDLRSLPAHEVPTAWEVGQFAGTLGMFVLLTIASVASTADHGTGGIVPTLQWTPRRGVLLAARTTVIVVTTTALGLLLVSGASLVASTLVTQMAAPPGDGGQALAGTAFVYAAGALLAVGLGLCLRSSAACLVAVLALMLVLPILLLIFAEAGFAWAKTIGELMPGSGALHLMLADGIGSPFEGMTTPEARLILGTWALALLGAGACRLLLSDADR